MHRLPILALAASLLFGCTSKSSNEPVDEAPGEVVKSSEPRDTSPDVTAEQVAELCADNADFAWAFYREIVEPGKNLFFSPYSLSVALAMTWAGARGNTEAEMAEALRFRLGQDGLHPAFNGLDLALESRAEASGANAPLPFVLNVTNALFGQIGFTFLDAFLDTLAVHYDAGLRLMDFIEETEASRVAINGWVSERTNDRIKELIPQGVITAATRLVLVNAIFFTASWQSPFDEANTSDALFKRLDGSTADVPTMRQTLEGPYADGAGFAAAELAYDGGALAMLLIVPEEGQSVAVKALLPSSRVVEIWGTLPGHQNFSAMSLPSCS